MLEVWGSRFMRKIMIGLIAAISVAACGGSSGDDRDTQNSPTEGQTIAAPTISSKATPIGGSNLNMNTDGNDYLVKFDGSANLTLSASFNNVWIADNQAIGSFYLSGSNNMIVFRPGSNVMSMKVTGRSNTIYIPTGANIVAAGVDKNGNSMKFYTR